MIYRFIEAERAHYSVRRLCRSLGVAPSGYYAWRQRPPSHRALANQALLVQIRAIHAETHQRYGSPRMHAELRARGVVCTRKRVERLMRLHHLRAHHQRRYHGTTRADPRVPAAPNRLAQAFVATAPNQKWLTDVTGIPTGEGWLYLAAVLDLYSRRVIGWALGAQNDTPLVRRALELAMGRRQPAAGTLHHSDRGAPYTSAAYQRILQERHLQVSMSGTGNCYDNAPMESFFATLKTELIHHRRYRTRAEARRDIIDYVEGFYNARRRHSALGYRSPLEFEQSTA